MVIKKTSGVSARAVVTINAESAKKKAANFILGRLPQWWAGFGAPALERIQIQNGLHGEREMLDSTELEWMTPRSFAAVMTLSSRTLALAGPDLTTRDAVRCN